MSEREEKQPVGDQNSGVRIPPRSTKQETGEQHPLKAFTYFGYHFIPVGFCANKGTAVGERRIRMMEWAAEPLYSVSGGFYSKKSFLEFADSEADVYYCVEHGCYYMPGERKLFEYRGKFQWIQGKETQENKENDKVLNHRNDLPRQNENMKNMGQGENRTTQVLSRKRWN